MSGAVVGAPGRHRLLRRLWRSRLLRLGLVALVLAFWGHAVAGGWTQARGYHWRISLPLLALSFAALFLHLIGLAITWAWLLRRLGQHLPASRVMRIWLTAQIARYIPGLAWDALGRVGLSVRAGLDATTSSLSVVLELATGVLAYVAIVVLSLPFWPDSSWLGYLRWAPLLLPLGLIALYPPLLARALSWGLRLLHRPAVTIRLSFLSLIALFAQELAWRVLEGAGVLLLVEAIMPGSLHLAPRLLGAEAAAWLLGFIAVFAPAGMGVREGTFALLMAPAMPISVGTAVAIAYRLLCSLRDLLALGLASRLDRGQA